MKNNKRIVLITGGSRGIGSGLAIDMAKAGYTPLITYKNDKESAKKTIKKIRNFSPDSKAYKLDVAHRENIKEVLYRIIKDYKKLDILINNAGINQRCLFDEITDEDWDLMFETNLKGPFMLTQECFNIMKRGSRIINISSVAGQYHGPKTVHYAVSKAALNSLTKSTARYGAEKGIYVNAIAPGLILTDQNREEFESGAADKIINETTLLKKPGNIIDVSSACLFLSDPMQNYMTGQVIALSGGAILDN